MGASQSVRWYYDFISPFAYLQHHRLLQLLKQNKDLVIEPVPVLFAGLLKHYAHKGPAEIPSKRTMTYRYCYWFAKQNGIPFNMPHGHPFNPLPMLRLAIARNNDTNVIDALFRHIWVDSSDAPDFATMQSLCQIKGFENANTECADEVVKEQLRDNTAAAIETGVFGVPTLEVNAELFWGLDMTDMAMDFLSGTINSTDQEYKRLGDLPVAKARI